MLAFSETAFSSAAKRVVFDTNVLVSLYVFADSRFAPLRERIENGELGWPDDQVDAVIDVADQVEAKFAALMCHATQFGPESIFRQLPEAEMAEVLRYEYFAQAMPEPVPQKTFSDLFADLPL